MGPAPPAHVTVVTRSGLATRPSDGRTKAFEPLLEAITRALDAHRALLLPPGVSAPRPRRVGWLRREETYPVTVEVPGEHPPRRLVVELTRPPTSEDRLVAHALARMFEPVERPKPQRRRAVPPDPKVLLEALRRPTGERPEALLRAALAVTEAAAGALATAGDEPEVWTRGPGRPILRNAALEAVGGPDGRVEAFGRVFTVRRLVWDGGVVGGLAVEGSPDPRQLGAVTPVLAAALRPTGAEEPPSFDPEAELETALTVLPIPALAVDHEGRLAGASPEAERLFALTDFDLGTAVAHRLSELAVDRVLAGGDLPREVLIGERWYEPVCATLPSGGRLFVLLDRTRTDELEQAQEELVAAMAHELRTPIAGVKALLEVLKVAGARQPAERRESMVEEGIREIGRLERLVEDLLLATRAATGGIVAHPDTIEMRPVADNVVRQVRERYPDRVVELSGEARVRADPALARHALWHLVDNAAKFSGAGDRIRVEIEETSKGVEVHVHDEGPGIFSGNVPDLFRPFHRLDRNTAAPHGGAGVGLYLVKAVLEAQGGSVWVRTRLGRGSTFSLRLPAASEGRDG